MESVGAILCFVVVSAVSFGGGYAWATSRGWAVALGAIFGVAIAVLYMLVSGAVGALIPRTLEPRSVGVHFMILLAVLPPVGALFAEIARVYAIRRNTLR
ncbi:MAG: hypothetical protein ACHQK9_05150 [Reyranellales bacterium]